MQWNYAWWLIGDIDEHKWAEVFSIHLPASFLKYTSTSSECIVTWTFLRHGFTLQSRFMDKLALSERNSYSLATQVIGAQISRGRNFRPLRLDSGLTARMSNKQRLSKPKLNFSADFRQWCWGQIERCDWGDVCSGNLSRFFPEVRENLQIHCSAADTSWTSIWKCQGYHDVNITFSKVGTPKPPMFHESTEMFASAASLNFTSNTESQWTSCHLSDSLQRFQGCSRFTKTRARGHTVHFVSELSVLQ